MRLDQVPYPYYVIKWFSNQNSYDTFIQQNTLSRTKLPNFRFLAYV